MRRRPESLWRNGAFRNLWLAHSVSLVGTHVTMLAFPMAALLLHASALEVSLLAAVEFLPVLLLGLPAGAWVERLPLRPVLIITDLVRAAALVTVPVAYALDLLTMPLLYVVAFAIGLGTLFFDVAQLSLLPGLVEEEQLTSGNAKLETSRSVAQLAGPAVGGVLVQALTAPVALAMDVLSYLASAVFLLRVPATTTEAIVENPEPATKNEGLRAEIGEGLRFVFGHRLLRPIVLCAGAAELAFAAVLALQVVYAVNVLHLSAGVVGAALAIGNAGGLLGAMLSTPAVERFGPGRALIGSVAVFAAGALMIPMAGGAVGFGAGLFVVYLGVVLFNVVQTTLCQMATPARLLGRMNATLRFITWGTVPLGAALGGLLVAPLGLRGVLWLAGAITVVSIVPPLFSPVRALMSYPSANEPAADEPVRAGSPA
ncbi:MFS transporter [Actinomadura barringtoniae]|uniref:MFS transporter n=1 Tax=Actinomadura barringtoniae TaxID=1427535 RepID=A0A939PEK1_9ACTN|nr:MFS transporter [Actinomadura barringtoniae]MBO2447076.1 MFS transporter [Actinomadura barringtoniae]